MADEPMVEAKTPSQTLIDCLTEFGESEPRDVIVIIQDEDGWIKWRISRPLGSATVLGMLDLTKLGVLKNMDL